MRRASGFTLIELMVVVAIVAILAAFAYNSYTEQVRKARRTQALNVLSDLALRQEKWRGYNATYGTTTNLGVATLINATNSPYYTITATNLTGVRYTLTATPRTGSAQVGDRCGNFIFDMQNGTLSKTTSTGASGCF
jgi:type IV pilus assembly protein PilE